MVEFETRPARRHRPLIAGRPQAHVDLIEHAFGGRCRHGGDEALREAGEILVRAQWTLAFRGFGIGRRIIDEDEVEIGGCGHFAPAKLAHSEDRDAAAGDCAMALGNIGRDEPQ